MNTVLSQHLVAPNMVGSATSILTLGRSLGQTVMAGLYGAILNLVIRLNLHDGIHFSQVNGVISSSHQTVVAHHLMIDQIILHGLHGVFISVVIILILVIVINWLDPNRKIIQ
jgi:hypothetical protein